MNKEMIETIESVSNERGISPDQLFAAIEEALATSAQTGENRDRSLRILIDRESGGFSCYRCWEVVEDEAVESPQKQISVSQAREQYKDIEVGDVIEDKIDSPMVYGRIAAQVAKKVIQQKLREAEGEQIVASYKSLVGEIVRGTVRYDEPSGITVDLGKGVMVLIPRNNLIATDGFRPGDRAQCILSEVREEGRPPYLIGTRTSREFLEKLFIAEVPEISQGHIRIINAVREPGVRSKLAVRSLDPKLDPIGSCVGVRGSRVQAVSNELSGERIDVVLWDESVEQFVVNAMAPAEVETIVMNEDNDCVDVIVQPDKLSQAIGKEGLNVRLASELAQHRLNVMDTTESEERAIKETNRLIELFHSRLGVGEDVSKVLVDEGMRTIEDIAYKDIEALEAIEEFDRALAEELHSRANDHILEKLLSNQGPALPSSIEDIIGDKDTLSALANEGIDSLDALAGLAVHELLNILPGLHESDASDWIMRAREPLLQDGEKAVASDAEAS